jgi:hypothetical protein
LWWDWKIIYHKHHIFRKVTQQNDTIQVGAPMGAAAFNVQGSTLHCLLGINMSQPEETLQETKKGTAKVTINKLIVSLD